MRDLNEVQRLRLFCKKLPKIELHAHLNGSVSLSTIEELAQLKRELCPEYEGLSEIEKNLLQPKDVITMDECFKLFPIVHSLMLHPEAVLLATKRVIEEFAADGVIYLELRTTPKATPHMTKMDYVNAIVNGIKAATSGSCDIVVRVLLSIDRARGLKDAKDTVELLRTLVEQNEQLIVGLDLSGNPKVDGRQYIELLEEVRAMGLKVTLHLAELSDCVEELDSFIDFQPDRIGHGTFIHSHGNESTVRSIIAQRVPFEICLSSNQLCGSTKSIADSHCKTWRKIGNPVCLSTDDKGLMGTDLSNEYFIAAKAFDLTETDLIEGARTSLNAAFISHKDPALQDLHEKLDLFEENPQVLP